MHRFYVEKAEKATDIFCISGEDVNHIKNVLRMHKGDLLTICDGHGIDYSCSITDIDEKQIFVKALEENVTKTELSTNIYLFQGIPKKDKMELIIQKAVELGVYQIIPVFTKRTVVKLEDRKKELKKQERWQSISESAAKQSGRGRIPIIERPMKFQEAIQFGTNLDVCFIPYEMAEDINVTRQKFRELQGKQSIGIFIGPEGGFEQEEVLAASQLNFTPITLGRRILRTETAGLAVLSILMYELEA